ncbi:MAG: extracellular solute-binding protein, partial [Chloroflexota bacterium]
AAALAGCGGPGEPVDPRFAGTPPATPVAPGPAGRWQGRTVTVSSYGGEVERALRTLVWDPFERTTGCSILSFANESAGPGTPVPVAPVDLALADPVSAARFIAAGGGRPLDASLLPGAAAPGMAAAGAMPAHAYALVNCRKRDAFAAGAAPDSWTAWWDVDALPAPRTMRRGAVGTLEIALLADGADPGALYPLDIDRAIASLARIAEAVGDRWWTRGIEPVGWISADRATLGVAWHHRVLAGQWDGRAVDFTWNQGILATDCWLAPRSGAAADIADDLLAWTLSPLSQAAFARETRLGPVNAEAFAYIEPWLLDTLPTAEPQAASLVRLDGAWWAERETAAAAAMDDWLATLPGARGTTAP